MITLTVIGTAVNNMLRTTPRQVIMKPTDFTIVGQHGNNAIVQTTNRLKKKLLVAESAEQITYLINGSGYPSQKESLAAAGTTQGGATQINKYIAEVTTATAGSAEGVKLPKATDARIEEVFLVINKTAVAIKVYPASGDFINEQEVDTSLTLTLGEMATFYIKYWSGSEPE